MTLDIQPLDPELAPERQLVEYHAMRAAAVAVDFPEDPPLTYRAAIGRLRTPPVEEGPCRFWVGTLDGRLAGSVRLALPEGTNDAIAHVEVHVHPEQRRRGLGTALLRAVLPAVLASGRPTVLGHPMKPDSAGAVWTAGLGFEVTHSMVMQVLDLAATPARRWELPGPAGYRLAHWTGAAPDELLDSYAVAREAVQDAPLGRSSYRPISWTPARVRENERELADAGAEQRVAVAVEDGTDRIAGVHVVHFYPHRPEIGYVHDTSVLAEHRGHGLGAAMKAGLTRRLRAERPDAERICTTTTTTNRWMIDINHGLGYRTARTMNWVETPAERLAERLAELT
ncbi:GNAT family N-acetyltransferase [Kitasatospora sp. NPDC088134]|uniref:GNAT family N-acetyltransferase n=1 Tax=Kitasatospora sp. NPDC088134 TaxID=3364071 RepID=UPI0038176377